MKTIKEYLLKKNITEKKDDDFDLSGNLNSGQVKRLKAKLKELQNLKKEVSDFGEGEMVSLISKLEKTIKNVINKNK